MDHQNVKNPLEIPEVLCIVLNLLNFEDLKQCRQVNRLWQRNSLSLVRKLCNEITFANSSENGYYVLEDMRRITNLINNSDGTFPVTKFVVFTSIARNPATDNLVVGRFISSVNQTVTELTIIYRYEDWAFHDNDNCLAKGIEFSSLTLLQLHLSACPGSRIHGHIEQFVTKVIEASPQLSTIAFPITNELYTCWIEAVSKAASLRNLIMRLPSKRESMQTLSTMAGLKLQRLNIFITNNTGELSRIQMPALFKMFLQSQSATLKILGITDVSPKSGLSVEFPVMKKLAVLEIMDQCNGSDRTKFTNISYKQQFPVLKRLDFSRSNESWRDFFPADSRSRQGLATIQEINFPAFFTKQDTWAVAIKYNLARWMPDKNVSIQQLQRLPNVEDIDLVNYFIKKIDEIRNNVNDGN